MRGKASSLHRSIIRERKNARIQKQLSVDGGTKESSSAECSSGSGALEHTAIADSKD